MVREGIVSEKKSTILVVEDDLDIADMLNAYFRVQGYEVHTVNWGEDGVRACLTSTPDLVILDIRLPDIDGFEVAHRLRNNRKTKEIPIIFLTEKRERSDRLKGLELQADDDITKPFDIQELRLRVRNALQRSRQGSLTNPVTGMPEGSLVDEALTVGQEHADTVLMVVSLMNLNRFREVYGFVASDDLLRAVSLMVRDAVRDLGTLDDFIGHLTPADFLIVTHQAQAAALRERIRKRLEQSFDYFYSDQDREQGTFRNKQLGVQINELVLSTLPERDIPHMKSELEQFYH
ncbi:MAG: response regulator [Chloroflexi bacterium]|nr:MAG: response regulator [Chloroflexota bacterium]